MAPKWLTDFANRADELVGDPIERGVNAIGRSVNKSIDKIEGAPLYRGIAGAAPLLGGAKPKAPKTQSPAARLNESLGTTASDIAGPTQTDATTADPFAALNQLIPDPLTMQLFYDQTVAPLIQNQVKQMTDYGNLLKTQPGGGALGGINQQLGNQYSALAAALGAQTAAQPSFDALMSNISQAKSQQTDIYSLIKSLISAQQQPAGDLAAILAAAGLGGQ